MKSSARSCLNAPLRFPLRTRQDVRWFRKRVRRLVRALEYPEFDQVRIVAAATELARHVRRCGSAGARFSLHSGLPPVLRISIGRFEPGALPGSSGNGHRAPQASEELAAALHALTAYSILNEPDGAAVCIDEPLPPHTELPPPAERQPLLVRAIQDDSWAVGGDFARAADRSVLRLMGRDRAGRAQVDELRNELEETNRGVLALYRELDEQAARLHELNETLERRVDERTAVAERQADQLRALASDLTQAEQRERRRLAQILHDHLQQLLVAAKLNLAVAGRRVEDETARRALDGVEDLLGQSIDASRSLAVELSPPILQERGLGEALHWLGRWMEDKHRLAVDVDADPQVDPETPEVRIVLFEIARELLFNVVKHAGVDQARVRMARRGAHHVQIEVADEGRGFDPHMRGQAGEDLGGFGLSSVANRLQLLGGGYEVDSRPGAGTRITVYAPLCPEPEPAGKHSTS